MATVPKTICDDCQSGIDVDECVVSYQFGYAAPWAVDLCSACFTKRFGDLKRKSHPAKRNIVRPRARIKVMYPTPEQLGEA